MKDSTTLPAFPTYGDGFTDFSSVQQGNGAMPSYMPNSEDSANATTIKQSHALLAVCVRSEIGGVSRREVSKRRKTKKRKREQSSARVDSDEPTTNGQQRRRSARLRVNGSVTRAGNDGGGSDDDDDDFMS